MSGNTHTDVLLVSLGFSEFLVAFWALGGEDSLMPPHMMEILKLSYSRRRIRRSRKIYVDEVPSIVDI